MFTNNLVSRSSKHLLAAMHRPRRSIPVRELRRTRLHVEALEDMSLPSSMLTAAPLTPAPVFDAAVARPVVAAAHVDLSPATVSVARLAAFPHRQFNGTYRATFTGRVTTPMGSQPVRMSFPFQARNGVIYAEGRRIPGKISSTGAITMNISYQGVNVRIKGVAKLIRNVPRINGTWSVAGAGVSASGTWVAVRLRR
jgi:hypothetical protein